MNGRLAHRSELDGLRGIAVLVVLAAHAGVPGFSSEGGLAGVTLFFVLSGFLITGLLVVERGATGRIDLRSFYIRRGLRLFPALLALLVVVAAGSMIGLWSRAGGDMRTAIPAVLLYVGNWAQVAGVSLGPLGHTWSLAIEEQFYLLWPIGLILALRFAGRRTIAVILVLIAIMVTPWRVDLLLAGDLGHAFAGTDAHADALLLGCAIALLEVRLPAGIGILGAAGVVACAILWGGGGSLVYMIPAATVLSALAVAGPPKLLGWAPLAHIGRISYGLYLWHFLFIWWGLPWPVVITTSVLAAELSYVAVERPFLRLKDRMREASAPSTATPGRVIAPAL
jgi:peptidoglycan/LPS O-acetylase OafA/YrhL